MPIKYALFENNVTADPDDYMAIVRAGWVSRPRSCDPPPTPPTPGWPRQKTRS